MYNSFFPQYQNQQMQQLIRVNGIDGAKMYQVPANSTVALFDNDSDVMYIKSTDCSGFPVIRTFDFTQRIQRTQAGEYITRQEYSNIMNELSNIKEMVLNGKQSIQQSRKQQQSDEHSSAVQSVQETNRRK